MERVERKLKQLMSTGSPLMSAGTPNASSGDFVADLRELTLSPPEAFYNALRRNQIDRAYGLLERVKAMPGTGSRSTYITCVRWIASVGYGKAFELIDTELLEVIRKPDSFQERNEWVRQLVEGGKTYFENTGQLQEGIRYFEDLYGKVVGMVQFEDDTKAMIANKVGMLAYAGDLYEICVKYLKLATSLERDPSYFYNLALAYRETRMDTELNETLRTLSGLPNLDEDHLKLLRTNGY